MNQPEESPMPPEVISRYEHEFRIKIVEALTALKSDTRAIVDRLTTLATAVERHQIEMSEMRQTVAKHMVADNIVHQETSRWEKRLTPLLKTGGLILVGLALGHGSDLLKILK